MSKQSLKQIAYQSIKDKILNCEYAPNSFLNEDLLCEEFGVSRTPIRDALGRLEQEHLITILPKKGFLVAPVSVHEINMVFEGRLLIEPYVIQTYCSDFPSDLLDLMYHNVDATQRVIETGEYHPYSMDTQFHQSIISRCTNHYLTQTYSTLHNQNYRLRIISGKDNLARLNATVEEHRRILECISRNYLNEAAEAMRTHLTNSKIASFQAFLEGKGSF